MKWFIAAIHSISNCRFTRLCELYEQYVGPYLSAPNGEEEATTE